MIAPQNLLLMNYDLVMESADKFADSIMQLKIDDRAKIEVAYGTALGRAPTKREIERALAFLSGLEDSDEGRSWSLFCQSLLACNEFIYLR